MSERFGEAMRQLEAAVDALQSADALPLADDEVVDLLGRFELVRSRLAPVEHALVGAAAERSLAGSHKCRDLPTFLTDLLRIDHAEARSRVRAAEALTGRTAPSGATVGPRLPLAARALASGEISARHAAVIGRHVDALPGALLDSHAELVEQTLLDWSRQCEPAWVDREARKLIALLDQDGQLRDERERHRRREVTLRRRADGSGVLSGELTAEAAEALQTCLDSLTRPVADSADGVADVRTPGQRRHDAMLALCFAAMRAELLPNAGGLTCTMLLTMDADAWVTGVGTARTGHGYTISAQQAKKWAGHGSDARFLLTLLGKTRNITAYSTIQRIFTEQQRLALVARDGGCSFPGCDAAPAFCETDHLTEFSVTGRTSVDDGALECSFEHRHRKDQGWTCRMIDGLPHWTAPPWIDPAQIPRANQRHLALPSRR